MIFIEDSLTEVYSVCVPLFRVVQLIYRCGYMYGRFHVEWDT
jgi:hypothetical protein